MYIISPDSESLPVTSEAVQEAGEAPCPTLPAHLEQLADRARDYVDAASSANTRRAYASDWKHFSGWYRRQGLEVLPPSPQTVGLYITACASGTATADRQANSVATIERRLSALTWNYAQRGTPLDRADRHIATVLAGIRNIHGAPPRQKEAVLPEDVIAMLETLDRGSLRGLRDRAMLLLGFAGGLRRSEIVGLDVHRDDTEDGQGWVEILDKGMIVTLRGKTGWREIEIGRGSSDATCPIVALQTWHEARADRPWAAIPPGDRPRQRRRSGSPERPTGRPAGQTRGARRRGPWRPARRRAGRKIRWAFSAIRPRLLGRGRRALRAKTAWARERGADPPLSAAARPLPSQSHQGCRSLKSPLYPSLRNSTAKSIRAPSTQNH
ncbi:integrase [Bradyrhizobium sp. i1.3.6]